MKCKYYDKKGYKVLDGQLTSHCRKPKKVRVCPKDMDFDCNIKKPKPKLVRIKAWGRRNCLQGIWADTWNTGLGFPCTILVEKKHLKGEK